MNNEIRQFTTKEFEERSKKLGTRLKELRKERRNERSVFTSYERFLFCVCEYFVFYFDLWIQSSLMMV